LRLLPRNYQSQKMEKRN